MLKRLISSLLCLFIVILPTNTATASDSKDFSTRAEELITELDTNPQNVSLNEIASFMNKDANFACEAYTRLTKISTTIDIAVDQTTTTNESSRQQNKQTNEDESKPIVHDFIKNTDIQYTPTITTAHLLNNNTSDFDDYGLNPSDPKFKTAICKIFLKSPQGHYFVGSGTAITNFTIVTCAHILYNHENIYEQNTHKLQWQEKSWAQEAIIVPGWVGELPTTQYNNENGKPRFDGKNTPYGAYGIPINQATNVLIDEHYITDFNNINYTKTDAIQYDWAVIKTPNGLEPIERYVPVGNWANTINNSEPLMPTLNLYGYPQGDKRQTLMTGYAMGISNKWACLSVPGTKGMSGGPIIDDNGFLVGIYHGYIPDTQPRGCYRTISRTLQATIIDYAQE